MDRRDFLKKAFQIGGIAALYRLGLSRSEAFWFARTATGGGGGAPTTYANWNQASETGLSVNQGGGTNNTHVMMLENPAGGGNETGVGYVTGADLVWTQAGNLAGSVGGFRSFDGGDDLLTITSTLADIFAGTNAKTIIVKLKAWVQLNESCIDFKGVNDWLLINRSGANPAKVQFLAQYDGGIKLQASTADDIDAVSTWYAALCDDGTETFGGITIAGSGAGGQPTKWSDFAAGKRVSAAAGAYQYSAGDFATHRAVAYDFADIDIAWIILSRVCLIDKAA